MPSVLFAFVARRFMCEHMRSMYSFFPKLCFRHRCCPNSFVKLPLNLLKKLLELSQERSVWYQMMWKSPSVELHRRYIFSCRVCSPDIAPQLNQEIMWSAVCVLLAPASVFFEATVQQTLQSSKFYHVEGVYSQKSSAYSSSCGLPLRGTIKSSRWLFHNW